MNAMADVVARIDDFGKPAWIAVMVAGFILFWPVGLGILAYMLWSGRMGCGWNRNAGVERWREHATEAWDRSRERWAVHGRRGARLRPTGNGAFDEYREQALNRLEEEAQEFRSFLERLRAAKDRQEFDDYMRQRRERPTGPETGGQTPAPQT
jgi:Protein of unknown function (DUF2852)